MISSCLERMADLLITTLAFFAIHALIAFNLDTVSETTSGTTKHLKGGVLMCLVLRWPMHRFVMGIDSTSAPHFASILSIGSSELYNSFLNASGKEFQILPSPSLT